VHHGGARADALSLEGTAFEPAARARARVAPSGRDPPPRQEVALLSWTFAAAALLLALVTSLLPARVRAGGVLACSVAGVALVWSVPIAPIVAVIIVVHLLARAISNTSGMRQSALLAGGIGAIVAAIAWLRPTHPAHVTLTATSSLVGLSYFSLKLIQHLVDAGAGRVGGVGPVELGATVFFLPTFPAGPIERTDELTRKLEAPLLDWRERVGGLERIAIGLGKKLLLANPLLEFAETMLRDPASATRLVLLGTIYAIAVGIYLDFAGYSDIAIGTARLAGIQVRENFDWPYLGRNLNELWQRWHMSLTSWLRDFIFVPVARRLLRRTKRPLASQVAAQLVTMVACGLWHGVAWNFVVWGLYHAAGLSVVSAWRHGRASHPSHRPLRDVAATLATFHYFAFGMLIFASDLATVRIVVSRMCRM
jgi:alginate O-acetyltransferase complex protein AlgI